MLVCNTKRPDGCSSTYAATCAVSPATSPPYSRFSAAAPSAVASTARSASTRVVGVALSSLGAAAAICSATWGSAEG